MICAFDYFGVYFLKMEKEIWKEIEGYDGIYSVSSIGNVRSIDRMTYHPTSKQILVRGRDKAIKDSNGYRAVFLTYNTIGRNKLVHRLVAQAFIPNPENKPQVNHINGVKHDNRVENLEWATSKENIQHVFENNLKKRGEDFVMSKLTNQKVTAIKRLLRIKPKVSKKNLAKKVGVVVSVIYQITYGKSWNHIKI